MIYPVVIDQQQQQKGAIWGRRFIGSNIQFSFFFGQFKIGHYREVVRMIQLALFKL